MPTAATSITHSGIIFDLFLPIPLLLLTRITSQMTWLHTSSCVRLSFGGKPSYEGWCKKKVSNAASQFSGTGSLSSQVAKGIPPGVLWHQGASYLWWIEYEDESFIFVVTVALEWERDNCTYKAGGFSWLFFFFKLSWSASCQLRAHHES